MSRALSVPRPSVPPILHPRLRHALPTPAQLASLGTVLCLYRADSSELGGWQEAVAAHACQGLDSDGVRESVCFIDRRGRCCWRLYLLPDSDFLAWDRLAARLPAQPPASDEASVGERLWRRLALSLGGQRWRMCALQLHVVEGGDGLAASLASLSSLGAAMARRVARRDGVEGEMAMAGHPPAVPASGRHPAHPAW